MSFLVAIDGPAGSGKGTIAKEVAEKLNLVHIDTGAMYRCITLYAINHGVDKSNEEAIVEIAKNMDIDQQVIDGKQRVMLNGEDVTEKIRTEQVNTIVSDVASIQAVRSEMLNLQRNIAKGKNVIMEGRDIGTVVFPNADVKIFLDGSLEVRAKRRYKEYIEKGIDVTLEEVKQSIINRDKKDSTRKFGTLKMAEDAIRVDTTELNIEQVVNKVIHIIQDKRRKMDI